MDARSLVRVLARMNLASRRKSGVNTNRDVERLLTSKCNREGKALADSSLVHGPRKPGYRYERPFDCFHLAPRAGTKRGVFVHPSHSRSTYPMKSTNQLLAVAALGLLLTACGRPENPAETREDVAEERKEGAEDVRDAQQDAMENQADRVGDPRENAQDAAADQYKIDVAKADADYAVAKEKCDATSGQDKDACEARAKADHETALAQAKNSRDAVAP